MTHFFDSLAELYAQWKSLSVVEGDAIRYGHWSQVSQCQTAKLRLQPLIIEATGRFHEALDYVERPLKKVLEGRLRTALGELIQIERDNSAALAEQQKLAASLEVELESSSRNLKNLQRCYGRSSLSIWDQYS